MISHFELYFDLVLVRIHQLPSPLSHATSACQPSSPSLQVGSFLHLGGLMNLDFGKLLKDSDVPIGATVSITETLPGILGTAPNFTAAIIFFVALWNSWCRNSHATRSAALTGCSQVHVCQLHGPLPVVRRRHNRAFFHILHRCPLHVHCHRRAPTYYCILPPRVRRAYLLFVVRTHSPSQITDLTSLRVTASAISSCSRAATSSL